MLRGQVCHCLHLSRERFYLLVRRTHRFVITIEPQDFLLFGIAQVQRYCKDEVAVWIRRSPGGEVSTLITNVDLGLVAGRNLLGAFVELAFVEPAFVAFDIVWLQLPFLV